MERKAGCQLAVGFLHGCLEIFGVADRSDFHDISAQSRRMLSLTKIDLYPSSLVATLIATSICLSFRRNMVPPLTDKFQFCPVAVPMFLVGLFIVSLHLFHQFFGV